MTKFSGPYHMHNGSLFHEDRKICHSGEEIAIVYDNVDKRLWKHGLVFDVQNWFSRAAAGALDLAAHGINAHKPDFRLATLPANAATCERLNACLSDASTLRALIAAGVL